MIWQTVLDVIDAVESWIAGQSYWVQVVVLLAVLGPLCYLVAGVIDRVVEAVLARHSRRDLGSADPRPAAPQPARDTTGDPAELPAAGVATGQVETGQDGTRQDETGQAGAVRPSADPAEIGQPGAEHAKANK